MHPIYIYALCDPRTNQVHYIGQTRDPQHRLYGHCSIYEGIHEPSNPLRRWIVGLRKSGTKPAMLIVEKVRYEDRLTVESFYIEYFRYIGAELFNYKAPPKRYRTQSFAIVRKVNVDISYIDDYNPFDEAFNYI